MRFIESSMIRRSVVAAAVLAIAGFASTVRAANPPSCNETGPALLLRELRDTNMDGIGDTPITGFKIQGETIYYEARLTYAGLPQCGYEGGTLCIDPPGAAGCTDVTPAGGIPLICGDPSCSPSGVASVKSKQLPYIVNTADFDTTGLCAGEVRAIAEYRNGTSHFGNDVFPVDADTPICNQVQTPTPTPSTTSTPTPTATPTVRPLHFQCWEAHHGPFATRTPGLVDMFGTSIGSVGVGKRICNPADKNDEDPTAPANPNHLVAYKLKESPAPAPASVTVTDQFGSLDMTLSKPEYLLVPTAKSLAAPPPPIVPAIDHYACYKATGARLRASGIKVVDQFTTLSVDIKQPLRLCVVTNKNNEGVLNPASQLMCYKVRSSPGTPKFRGEPTVFTNNQFGADTFSTFGPRELCVPATVVVH